MQMVPLFVQQVTLEQPLDSELLMWQMFLLHLPLGMFRQHQLQQQLPPHHQQPRLALRLQLPQHLPALHLVHQVAVAAVHIPTKK